jgi:nicotinamide mononucleotide transporter
MREILHNIATGLTTSSWLDQLNLVLNIIGVWLMIRRSLWAFPVGMVAVSVQGVLFYQSRFPADAALQIFYFLSFVWGWFHWTRDSGQGAELPVQRLSARGWIITFSASVAATVAWALTIGPWMQAVMPWRDAFIAAFSVAAQVLQVRKNIENWWIWIVVDVVAVASYWSAELAYTAFLYFVFLVMAFFGWHAWHKARQTEVVRA